jgi:hypothetical protein
MAFDIQQKKGDPRNLDGRVTVYAFVDVDPEELLNAKHSFASMIHNSLLVAQGNFKDQYNFRDFLKSELGITLEDGFEDSLAQLLERMEGLESTLDPQKLKERLENMDDIEEFIPTPAKIVPFHSEEEILDQEGDVFFIGRFKYIGNAVLGVQALPMFYQAKFREQEAGRIRGEIESIITQIERTDAPPAESPEETIEEALLKRFIPDLLYYRREPHTFAEKVGELRSFLSRYRFQEDVEAIISLLSAAGELTDKDNTLLALYARKIACVEKEDFQTADSVTHEIQRLQNPNPL